MSTIWTDTITFPLAVEVADADQLPMADMGATAGSRQRNVVGSVLRAQLGGASAFASSPGVGDDAADGYRAGSLWLNTVTDALFVCTDATAGAAVWVEFGAGAGDVVGPASAVSGNIATFNGTTGKLVQDGGISSATFATAAQGTLADSAVQPADPISINAQTGTTYTLVLTDLGKLVTLSNAAAITLTVPTNASVAFPVGTVIALQQMGAGAVTVVGDTGVTINGTTPGSETLTAGQYTTTASLTKHATDTWTLTGAVA